MRAAVDIDSIRLVGLRVELTLTVAAAVALVVTAVLWRRTRVWRRVAAGVSAVVVAALVAVLVNTSLYAYPSVADLLGLRKYPTPDAVASPDAQENGAVTAIRVPDTASHFGRFMALVWLPPQYFADPASRFPVAILTHGNPGRSTQWLDDGSAASTGLQVARSGHPTILVMPTVLQRPTGDSLCLDTPTQGNAETYVVHDVVAAVDSQLRTVADAAHRTLGGFSMGGFCALNLGLRHPDVFSVALAFSALTVCEPDAVPGGNEALFDAPNWQELVAENSPAVYVAHLDPARGPAVWLDVGEDETHLVGPLEELAGELAARGFAVEWHTRPGGHDFGTWAPALQEALPWAAARMATPSHA